jgi:hypothetical protein
MKEIKMMNDFNAGYLNGLGDAEAEIKRATEAAEQWKNSAEQWKSSAKQWSRACICWQDWAAGLLQELGMQPDSGQHGDKAARRIISKVINGLMSGDTRRTPIEKLMAAYLKLDDECERFKAEIEKAREDR